MTATAVQGNPDLVVFCQTCRCTVVPLDNGRCGWCRTVVAERPGRGHVKRTPPRRTQPPKAPAPAAPEPVVEQPAAPDLLEALQDGLTVEQQDCVLAAVRRIQGRAHRALHRIRVGEALNGVTQLTEIEHEAADIVRWAEGLRAGDRGRAS